MITLALDTTTRGGSIAVRRSGLRLGLRSGSPDVPHARRLPGDVLDLVAACDVSLADVSLYAVASGPGAFTGLRIGIATIQGLAFAHGRPVVAVSALEALAHASASIAAAAGLSLVGAWMDAARGEVFASLFERHEDGAVVCLDAAAVAPPEAMLTRWSALADGRGVLFAGDGAVRYRDIIAAAFGDRGRVRPDVPPLADVIGALGERSAAEGLARPPHAVRPLYVRRPDAELARERGLSAAPRSG